MNSNMLRLVLFQTPVAEQNSVQMTNFLLQYVLSPLFGKPIHHGSPSVFQ